MLTESLGLVKSEIQKLAGQEGSQPHTFQVGKGTLPA
jgi:hypothetical protein